MNLINLIAAYNAFQAAIDNEANCLDNETTAMWDAARALCMEFPLSERYRNLYDTLIVAEDYDAARDEVTQIWVEFNEALEAFSR